jgi:hypothetical protein
MLITQTQSEQAFYLSISDDVLDRAWQIIISISAHSIDRAC